MTAILSARRSIVAPRGGALAHLAPHQIAAPVITQCLRDAGLQPDDVDEVIVSNALGAGGNPARLCVLEAGLPQRIAGLSIDRQCAGGLDALLLGAAMIEAGQARVVVAGGVESYSQRPLRARGSIEAPEFYDTPPFAPNPVDDPDMATAAAALGVTRADADSWAMESHAKALAAREMLRGEIAPIPGVTETVDPFARHLTERLAGRARVIVGSVTHANAAVAADGAAFVVLARDGAAMARILRGATRGSDPRSPGLAPLAAIEAVAPVDLTHAEIMEAYAAQALAVIRGAGIDPSIVNRHGGALARGHPVGASGAVNAVRLIHDLARDGGTGLAAIAAAGGIGTAVLFEA